MRRRDDRLQAGAAEPVDGLPRHIDGKAREQRRHARNVAIVLTGLIRTTEDHVIDDGRVNGCAVDGGTNGKRGEIVRAHGGEGTTGPAYGRADSRNDERVFQLNRTYSKSSGWLLTPVRGGAIQLANLPGSTTRPDISAWTNA